MKKHLIFEKWYALAASILAGNPDPHLGVVVCENAFALFNPEGYEVGDIETFIHSIMQHIVKIHNAWLTEWERNRLGAVSNTEALVD